MVYGLRAFYRACLPILLLALLSGCGGPDATAPAVAEDAAESALPQTKVASAEAQRSADSAVAAIDDGNTKSRPVEEAASGENTAPSSPREVVDPADTSEKDEAAIVDNEHEKWLQSFARAKSIAKKEGKDILMDFTGSDWCGWCIRLHDEVFQYQTFHDYAEDELVLLELDFPRDKSKLTPEIVKQNEKLQAQFGIEGFPTILLLDAAGRPYAQTGYQAGGPAAYVEHLKTLQQRREARDAAFEAAESLKGVARAKKLDDTLESLGMEMIYPAYEAEIAEIIKLDAENTAGLKEKYTQLQLASRFQQRIGELQASMGESADIEPLLEEVQKLEQEFADYRDGKKQLSMMRLQILMRAGRHEDILAIVAERLEDEDSSKEDRDLYQSIRYSLQRKLKQNDEALATLDTMIESAGEEGDEKAQLLVNKSEFLVSLGRVDEARKVFEKAKEVASDGVQSRLEQIQQHLFPAGESDKKPAGDAEKETEPAADEGPEKPAADS